MVKNSRELENEMISAFPGMLLAYLTRMTARAQAKEYGKGK
jgi:hypothetical protein